MLLYDTDVDCKPFLDPLKLNAVEARLFILYDPSTALRDLC